jgi:hypothetical protein
MKQNNLAEAIARLHTGPKSRRNPLVVTRAVIAARLGISEAEVLRNERYVPVDMAAIHAQLTRAILSAPTSKRRARLEPRQRLASAFKCSPDALVTMALSSTFESAPKIKRPPIKNASCAW